MAVFVCLTALGLLPGCLVCLVIMRDMLIVGGVMLPKLTDWKVRVEPLFVSKLNTFLQIVLGMWVLGQAILGSDVAFVVTGLIYLTAATTLVSGTIYFGRWVAGYDLEAKEECLEVSDK